MYKNDDIMKIKIIVTKLKFIEEIVTNFKGITPALKDERIGRPAILMHFISITEQLSNIEYDGGYEIFSQFNSNDMKGIYYIRELIATNLDGLNLSIFEMVVRSKLPKIKLICDDIIHSIQQDNSLLIKN